MLRVTHPASKRIWMRSVITKLCWDRERFKMKILYLFHLAPRFLEVCDSSQIAGTVSKVVLDAKIKLNPWVVLDWFRWQKDSGKSTGIQNHSQTIRCQNCSETLRGSRWKPWNYFTCLQDSWKSIVGVVSKIVIFYANVDDRENVHLLFSQTALIPMIRQVPTCRCLSWVKVVW